MTLPSAALALTCGQCAAPVSADAEFCGACGEFLGWDEDGRLARVVPQERDGNEDGTEDGTGDSAEDGTDGGVVGSSEVPAEQPALSDRTQEARQEDAAVEDDALASYRVAADQALETVAQAERDAAQAQVRLERTRRRSADAHRRAERLSTELPQARARATAAKAAVRRAEAGARRATSAAKATAAGAAGDTSPERRAGLRAGARAAARAEQRAREASLQAQESAATLEGVLKGAHAEVSSAPGEVGAAQRARDAARKQVQAARRTAVAAGSELALQQRLLHLRAVPRRVVAMPGLDEATLREEADRGAEEAVRAGATRAAADERRQRREAAREDEQRSAAEQQADDREVAGAREGAGAAEVAAQEAQRAAPRARRAVRAPGPLEASVLAFAAEDAVVPVTGQTAQGLAGLPARSEPDRPAVGAVAPVEVRRRARRRAVTLLPPDDGPLPCPACGAGNLEARHLCRRCGVVLHVPAPPPAPLPLAWWRRLLRLGPPRDREPVFVPAGARPVPGGNPETTAAVRRARVDGGGSLGAGDLLRRVAPLLALAMVAAAVLVLVLTPVGRSMADALTGRGESVRERAGLAPVPVQPLATRASSTAPGSAPSLAVDGDPFTSWAPVSRPGTGERLGLTVAVPVDLVALRLTAAPGTGRPRPASITVHSLSAPPVVLRLRDTLDPQRLPLSLAGAGDVRLRIDDVYPGDDPALSAGFAEVELLRAPTRSVRQLLERPSS